ncbi:MAG: TetR/AcrR family transcriptional regulator [Acidimicrobiia bacterium]
MSVSRHAVRATRDAGKQTRRSFLEAATRLFRERGLRGVSVADIAAEVGAFPSQVTYYFGGKEQLFVEAACLDLLRLGSQMEAAAQRTDSPDAMGKELLALALDSRAPLAFVEAQLLARQRPEVRDMVQKTVGRLYAEGERAIRETLGERGWDLGTTPDVQIRLFWANILGMSLEAAGTGELFSRESTEAALLTIFRPA